MSGRFAFILVTTLLFSMAVYPVGADPVPNSIAYQGKLTNSSGQPFPDGPYQLVFKFYDAGSSLLWTSSPIIVATIGGLFTAQIASIPSSVFAGADVWLETIVEGQTLSPKIKFTSVPYALHAGGGGGGGAGWSLTGNSGTNPPTDFLGTTDSSPLLLKAKGFRVMQFETVGNYNDGGVNIIGGLDANSITDGVYSATIGGGGYWHYDGQNTTNYPNKVTDNSGTVSGGASNQAGDDAGTTSDKPYATVGGGQRNVASGGYATIPGGFENTASGNWSFAAGNRAKAYHQGAFVWADSTTADFASSGNNQFLIRASGGVGIGTSSPNHALTVQSANTSTLRLIGPGATYGYQGTLSFGDGSNAYIQEDEDDKLTISTRLRTSLMGGSVGVGTAAPVERLHVASGNAVIGGPNDFVATNDEAVLKLGDGNNYIKAVRGQGLKLGVYQGVDAIYLENGGNVNIKGNLRILSKTTSAIVAELGEGLDYAEGFNVSDDEVKPGTVLVIDPANPGKLAVSTQPYDRKVAGIVAGANNVGSGVRLGAGQFDSDVALAGRVYCNVDATEAAVEPGDLLTTSTRPGYAMKVTDHARAQGAILGKAMQPLAKAETGQILVLVTLQ